MSKDHVGSSRNILYQAGTIRSLLKRVYSGDMGFDKLVQFGDFGLGTFDKLNGEMVSLKYC